MATRCSLFWIVTRITLIVANQFLGRAKQFKNNPEILHNTVTALQTERSGFNARQRKEVFPFHYVQAASCFYITLNHC
jgi:hypothetical protein